MWRGKSVDPLLYYLSCRNVIQDGWAGTILNASQNIMTAVVSIDSRLSNQAESISVQLLARSDRIIRDVGYSKQLMFYRRCTAEFLARFRILHLSRDKLLRCQHLSVRNDSQCGPQAIIETSTNPTMI